MARSLALSLLGLFLVSPAFAQSGGADAFNSDLQGVWDTQLRPAIVMRLTQEARTQLNGLSMRRGILEVRVRSVWASVCSSSGD